MRSVLLLSFAILLLLAPRDASAQTFNVTGSVVDTTGAGLGGATVVVLSPDSTLLSFGITRNDGAFRLERVSPGERTLQVTFLGFDQHEQAITVTDGPLDVGAITLREAASELDELVVTADHIPLLVRRDTLDYNAAAFRVPPGANVEDLLRRLPGIEVDRDGTIRAQGEVVRRLLVDGREFFGDDPTVATRNLPADAVERVQVYDRQSETAELTGVDDGQRERTVDLQLKEDRRAGMFGNLNGAVGDPERFLASGTVNRFSPSTQVSVIGNANNLNRQNFSVQEYASFLGGFDRLQGAWGFAPVSGDNAPSDGFSTTLSGGLNLNRDFGEHTIIESSYLLYVLDRERAVDVVQREALGGASAAQTLENSLTDDRQTSHRFRLNARHTFSEGHDFRFQSNARFSGTTSDSFRDRLTERDATTTDNARRYDWTSNTLYGTATLTYRRRLAPGRTIVAEAVSQVQRDGFDTDLETTTRFFRDGALLTTEEIRQLQDQQRDQLTLSQSLTYTEPLSRRQLLEFQAEHVRGAEARDFATFDLVGGEPVLNDPLSLDFDRAYRHVRGGVTYRRSVEPLTLGAGVRLQATDLESPVPGTASRVFVRPLVQMNAQYAFGPQSRLVFNYSTSTREPSLREMQPLVETNDPLFRFVGNPTVRPLFQHTIWTFIQHYDPFTTAATTASLRFTYNMSDIVTTRAVDEQLRQTTSVTNADGTWTLSGYVYHARPFRSIRTRAALTLSPTYSRSLEFVNGERNASIWLRPSATLTLDNLDKEVLDLRAGGAVSYNDVRYSLTPGLDRTWVQPSAFANVDVRFAEHWRVGSDVNAQFYPAEVFGAARTVTLLGAHLSWTLPGTRSELRLEGFDLLNQNLGVEYSSTAQFVREQRTASLGRHMMLRWVYTLGTQGAQPQVRVQRG